MANKNKKKSKKPLRVIYKVSDKISEEERQRRLNAAFDILLNEVNKDSGAKLKESL